MCGVEGDLAVAAIKDSDSPRVMLMMRSVMAL